MRRVVYSQDALYKEKDKFIWIWIDPDKPETAKWVKKYKQKVLPTAFFCLFDGKAVTKLVDVVPLRTYVSAMKKLLRKNKSAWRKEKKKRDKAKEEEEKKKAEEEKKNEDEGKETEEEPDDK